MSWPLWVGAFLVLVLAVVHAWVGERLIVRHAVALKLPPFLGSSRTASATLRGSWHLVSVNWVVMAVMIVIIAVAGLSDGNRPFLWVIMAYFAAFGIFMLVATRGRHLAWLGSGLVAGLLWLATLGENAS